MRVAGARLRGIEAGAGRELSVRTFLRSLIGFAVVVIAAWVLHIANARLFAGKSEAIEHKFMQNAPATLVSVTAEPSGWPRRARLCFAIDSFASLPEADRSFYEMSEQIRLAAKGPLCMNGRLPDDFRPPQAGDRVALYFTIQDGGLIAPGRMEWNGRELAP